MKMPTLALIATLAACSPTFAQETKPEVASCAATRLIGSTARDDKGSIVADVNDVLIRGNTVTEYVLGTGGFLGIGQREVAVPPAALTIKQGKNGCEITTILTRDNLAKMPVFKH